MSDRWYPALANFLTPGGSTPTPTPTPIPVGGCTATFKSVGQWTGGFQGEVTVKNTGAATTNAWTVRWTFANGQQITQIWGGTLSASGAAVSVRNVAWNGTLAAGASATFGFLASWNGTNTAPVPTCSPT